MIAADFEPNAESDTGGYPNGHGKGSGRNRNIRMDVRGDGGGKEGMKHHEK
jgi:hypothetical protein